MTGLVVIGLPPGASLAAAGRKTSMLGTGWVVVRRIVRVSGAERRIGASGLMG